MSLRLPGLVCQGAALQALCVGALRPRTRLLCLGCQPYSCRLWEQDIGGSGQAEGRPASYWTSGGAAHFAWTSGGASHSAWIPLCAVKIGLWPR